jgi:hypothetical protein
MCVPSMWKFKKRINQFIRIRFCYSQTVVSLDLSRGDWWKLILYVQLCFVIQSRANEELCYPYFGSGQAKASVAHYEMQQSGME